VGFSFGKDADMKLISMILVGQKSGIVDHTSKVWRWSLAQPLLRLGQTVCCSY
jgi:hypothetical protein